MKFNEYQSAAKRTMPSDRSNDMMRLNAILGINGEAGELADLLKKEEFQGHEFESLKYIDEAGDVLWYLVQLSEALGTTLEFIAQYNVTKLNKRYPEGFSVDKSVNRII